MTKGNIKIVNLDQRKRRSLAGGQEKYSIFRDADVVKLVYTLVLGTNAARRGGSSPLIRTKSKERRLRRRSFDLVPGVGIEPTRL